MIKYDDIGIGYNRTRKSDPYLASRMTELLEITPNGNYLDVGCGTGNYTIALNDVGGNWVGIDPSSIMLHEAKKKSRVINWEQGVSENLPFDDNKFDGALACLTIHHWKNLGLGFREIKRVLKASGKFVIFTSDPEQMKRYWLNHYFPGAMEKSILQMPAINAVITSLEQLDFQVKRENYFVRPDLQDLFLQSGKHQPELYLDQDVINGISTFSSLATNGELEEGLSRLKNDIGSGVVKQVMARYNNELGDYLFLTVSTID